MQKAVIPSHKGKFTAKAKRAGMSVPKYAAKEASAKGTLGKEARLAQTFAKLRGGKMDAEDRKDHGVDEATEKSYWQIFGHPV